MYRDYDHVALILAALLKKSGKTRLRISDKTFRIASGRRTAIRRALVEGVEGWLADFGVLLVALERGGFALVSSSALEGAPSATLVSAFPDWKSQSKLQLLTLLDLNDDEIEE
jgi:hypothetical protein